MNNKKFKTIVLKKLEEDKSMFVLSFRIIKDPDKPANMLNDNWEDIHLAIPFSLSGESNNMETLMHMFKHSFKELEANFKLELKNE